MAIDAKMQERAVFYIDRRISTLETKQVDRVAEADMGISFAERLQREAAVTIKNEKQQHELDATQWCRARMLELK